MRGMSDKDSIQLVLHVEQGTGAVKMNQYASIVLTAIAGGGCTPQAAVDLATMEWAQHPEWDWDVERTWEEWGGKRGGLEEALVRLTLFIIAQEE